ncbi:MAG: hypothetical protein BWX70_02119 [Verrucomicrobia bacterium ADurb.Bin070]|nr:MAG: hypothetical protein BWX70_02119 [Verrucomicrobia bacterium ADurb.Bin070]
MAAGDYAGLAVAAHDLAVDIEAFAVFAQQRTARLKVAEGLGPLGVDGIVVDIHAVRQVDLRARDMQEAVGVAGGQGPRLGGIDHVVRHGGEHGGFFGGGAQGGKRFDLHGLSPKKRRRALACPPRI